MLLIKRGGISAYMKKTGDVNSVRVESKTKYIFFLNAPY